jgi:nitrate reductase NapAB chaperone NapD
LADTVNNKVIPALQDELSYVDSVTTDWGEQLDDLALVEEKYFNIANNIKEIRSSFATLDGVEITYKLPVWNEETLEFSTEDVTATISTNIEAFDTGGYTGEWGPSGRLAVLHQKEIVLNADDTKNLLEAVSLVRNLDGYVNTMIGNMFNSITNAISEMANVTLNNNNDK